MEYITRVVRCWHGSDAVAGKSSAFLGGSHRMGKGRKGLREGDSLPRSRNALLCIGVCLAVCLSGARGQFLVGLWDADFPGGTHPVRT